MPSFSDKFKDPRWIRRRDEIIASAEYLCQDCGVAADDLEVHICYFEQGREPWEYPHEVYRCLCRTDSAVRRPLEKEVRQALAIFTSAELDALHRALQVLAQVDEGERSIAMERFYVAAKRSLEEQPVLAPH